MPLTVESIGGPWLADRTEDMIDHIEHIGPVQFNEENRYLPPGVTPRPGYVRYDLFPFMREILECFDPLSRVREVNVMKGVQVAFTTSLLEAIILYYIGHIKTQAGIFLTADGELAKIRMDNNIMPMINESNMGHLIRSADTSSTRKTGMTKDYLQWEGGGSLLSFGAQNAKKMRMNSAPLLVKDELDGWPRAVGQDGNSDTLTDARATAYWPIRKILRGSTPLLEPSMIGEAYERGDKRLYMVLCKTCSFPQVLKHRKPDLETGIVGGFQWETDGEQLVLESVRYCCVNCGEPHFEHDKEKLFSTAEGAHWKPTAVPKEPGIRSYHLPAFYSPFGFRPWSKNIADFLDSFDPVTKTVKSIDKYQEYYNNTEGKPFRVQGSKVRFSSVSGHRRPQYSLGQIPNAYATEYSGSKILFLTCQVDVHVKNLAVSVIGWCTGSRPYLIDYWRFDQENDEDDCSQLESPVWQRLRDLIETAAYEADDGTKYTIAITFVDAGFSNANVVQFCSDYDMGVYPILGRDRPGKNQSIKEFTEFTTQGGTIGFKITVDHYKDRMASVLRRDWDEHRGLQPEFHFNAPVDTTDKQLKELTKETRKEKVDPQGNTTYVWHRPSNAPNELWDLLGYGYAQVEIFAWHICIQHFELEKVVWSDFWEYAALQENNKLFCRVD